MLPCVVNSRLHPRRTSRSRHCDANCVTASRLKSALTNCDACNSFRFCFYEICRVVLVFLTKDLHFNLHLAFPARALCALRPKSVSQLSCNQRVPHSFQKQPGGTTELGPFFGLQATGVAFGLSSFFSHSCALFAATGNRYHLCFHGLAHSFHHDGGCTPYCPCTSVKMKPRATDMRITAGLSRRALPQAIGLPRPSRGHESTVTSPRVAALPSECYDLVFHDPC